MSHTVQLFFRGKIVIPDLPISQAWSLQPVKMASLDIEDVVDLAVKSSLSLTGFRQKIKRPLVAVCGNGFAGKDVFANYLREHGKDVAFHGGMSKQLEQVIADWLYGGNCAQAFAERRTYRELWYQVGNALTDQDPSFLIKKAISNGNQLLVGIRRLSEFEAARRQDLMDLAIWIDRPATQAEKDVTNELTAEHCDVTVVNSSFTKLQETAASLARLLFR